MKVMDEDINNDRLVSLLKADSIGRREDVFAFLKLLGSIDDSCVIGIDGSWGTGKTFFIKQTKIILDSFNPYSSFSSKEENKETRKYLSTNFKVATTACESMLTAYYDAWAHDDEDDPVLSLMYEIGAEVSEGLDISIKGSLTDVLLKVSDAILDRNISDIVKTYKGNDIFSEQKNNKLTRGLINEFMQNCMKERGNKLVVFVDELDRCSPNFAVKLLERIKHYFCCENVIFVFAINFQELQKTIKKFYGESFDSCRYLDRFFDIRMGLPPVDMEKYARNIGLYSGENYREAVSIEVVKQMNMSLREAAKYLQMTKMATYKFTDGDGEAFGASSKSANMIGYGIVVPIAIGLKLTDTEAYAKFMSGMDSEWLRKIMRDNYICGNISQALLESDESYIAEENKTLVGIIEKIEKVYTAIFWGTQDHGWKTDSKVGRAVFAPGFKDSIVKAVDFVSRHADYSV